MEIHFQVESARLVVSVGDALIRRSSGVQSSLGNSSVLFRSCVGKALYVSKGYKRPSECAKKVKRPH